MIHHKWSLEMHSDARCGLMYLELSTCDLSILILPNPTSCFWEGGENQRTQKETHMVSRDHEQKPLHSADIIRHSSELKSRCVVFGP